MTLLVPTEAPLDRCELGLRAAKPQDPALLPALLDEVVRRLVAEGLGPTSALAVAGQVVRGSPWAGYRHGRGRLATLAATYLTWLAPPAPWRGDTGRVVKGRRGLIWTSPEGPCLVDVLACGPLSELHEAVKAHFRQPPAGGLLGVRLLQVSSPRTSVVYTTPTRPVRLPESPWHFEEQR